MQVIKSQRSSLILTLVCMSLVLFQTRIESVCFGDDSANMSVDKLLQTISEAKEGSTVKIDPGVYKLQKPLVIDKALTLEAGKNESKDPVVIECTYDNNIEIKADVVVKGLQIYCSGMEGWRSENYSCVDITTGNVLLEKCYIFGENRCTTYDAPDGSVGVLCSGKESSLTISNGLVSSFCEGVTIQNGAKGVFNDSSFDRNSDSFDIKADCTLEIKNSSFQFGETGGVGEKGSDIVIAKSMFNMNFDSGVKISGKCRVEDSVFQNNESGIKVIDAFCSLKKCEVTNNQQQGILSLRSQIQIETTDLKYNQTGMSIADSKIDVKNSIIEHSEKGLAGAKSEICVSDTRFVFLTKAFDLKESKKSEENNVFDKVEQKQ